MWKQKSHFLGDSSGQLGPSLGPLPEEHLQLSLQQQLHHLQSAHLRLHPGSQA